MSLKHECPVCAAMITLTSKGAFRMHGPIGGRCLAGGKTHAKASRLRPNDYLRRFHKETRRLVQEREHQRVHPPF